MLQFETVELEVWAHPNGETLSIYNWWECVMNTVRTPVPTEGSMYIHARTQYFFLSLSHTFTTQFNK